MQYIFWHSGFQGKSWKPSTLDVTGAPGAQVIDMLTALLRETLQDSPGSAGMAEAMGLGAGKAASAGVSATVAPYDPFSAAATASFDSSWCAPTLPSRRGAAGSVGP